MKTVLFFSSASRHSCRKRVAGVRRYFANSDIRVQVVEGNYQKINVAKVLEFWKPVGCIAECGSDRNSFTPASFGKIPVVYLDRDPALKNGAAFTVNADLEGSATLAAKELLSLDLPCYGFVGFRKNLFWSKVRQKAFAEAMALNGCACHVFDDTADSTIKRLVALRKWLKGLPKPCGIFAAFDGTAEEIVGACHLENINVPQDIALLGVDNNEEICEQTKPTLSSICPDFEKAGYLCGELLDLQLHDPKAKAQSRTFGLTGVVRRRSTIRSGRGDSKVTDTMEYIRQNACKRIRVIDVARFMGCSKRTAELRFLQFVGHTIADEIREVRIAQAFNLLRKPDQAIDSIANLCGYASDSTLRYAFKARTGMSMREWRRKNGLS